MRWPNHGPGAVLVLLLATLTGCGVSLNGLRQPDVPKEVTAADTALKAGERAKAIQLFDAAVRKRRTDPNVYLAIASICQSRSQWDLLAQYAEQGAQALPSAERDARAQLYLTASVAYDRLGSYSESARVAEQALRLAPDDPSALNALGYAYAQSGTRLDDAIKLTTQAIEAARTHDATPEQIGAFVDSLGWAYYKANRINDAVTALASAANLAPGQMEIHYHLALAYRARGQYPDAEIELQRAIALDTDKNQEIRRLLREVQADVAARSKNQESVGSPSSQP